MKEIILMGDEITKENINKSLVSVKDAIDDVSSNIGMLSDQVEETRTIQRKTQKEEVKKPEVTLNVNILGNAATADVADQADKAKEDVLGNRIEEHYFPRTGFRFIKETGELYIINK